MSEIGSPQYPQLQQTNPLQTLSGIASTVGQLQQNQLFPQRQQELQNQIALQKLGITQGQLENAKTKFSMWSSVLGPLIGKGNITDSDITHAQAALVNSGAFTPQEVTGPVNNPDDPYPSDQRGGSAQDKKNWVTRHYIQGLNSDQQLNERLGAVGYHDTGQGTIVTSTARLGGNNYGGSNTNYGQITNTLPPPGTPVVNPNTGATGFYGTQPQSAQSPLPVGTTDVGQVPKAAGGVAPGSAMTSLPPGSTESVHAYQDLQQQVTGAPSRLNMINQAIKDLKGSSGTGRGTAYVNDVKAFIKAQAPWVSKVIGIDPDSVTNYDSANKWMTQYAQAMAAANGGHTDYQAMTTAAGNASTHIDEQAALNILHNARALEKMGIAKAQEYAKQNPGNTGLNYNTWSATQWAPNADVRGFGVDEGDIKANLREIQGLKKSDPVSYRAIVQSMAHAANNGQLNKDALAQAMREMRAGQ